MVSFKQGSDNPLDLSDVEKTSTPIFADIQEDLNAGAPRFTAPQTNPFGLTNVGNDSTPTFADIDGDGDLDAFIGDYNGDTFFFQNTGSASSPNFADRQVNPFGLSNVGIINAPTFADIDSDGGLDAFIGDYNGNTSFFQNTPKNAPIPVSTNADSGAGSLRQAILTAASVPGMDTIDLSPISGQTITLQTPLPIFKLGNDVNITGGIGDKPTISGGGQGAHLYFQWRPDCQLV